jgi:hypothetical protein
MSVRITEIDLATDRREFLATTESGAVVRLVNGPSLFVSRIDPATGFETEYGRPFAIDEVRVGLPVQAAFLDGDYRSTPVTRIEVVLGPQRELRGL